MNEATYVLIDNVLRVAAHAAFVLILVAVAIGAIRLALGHFKFKF